jgi:hypothetical protein
MSLSLTVIGPSGQGLYETNFFEHEWVQTATEGFRYHLKLTFHGMEESKLVDLKSRLIQVGLPNINPVLRNMVWSGGVDGLHGPMRMYHMRVEPYDDGRYNVFLDLIDEYIPD